jgi:RNA recognition motif-containing protein
LIFRYGDVDHVTLVKDRTTRESKGFAYVKYHRVSHAAKAFEECDQSYKPVFAEPKPSRSQNQVQKVFNKGYSLYPLPQLGEHVR